MKAAYIAARVNLVTQVAEVANFSCCQESLELGQKPRKKIFTLQSFERNQSTFK